MASVPSEKVACRICGGSYHKKSMSRHMKNVHKLKEPQIQPGNIRCLQDGCDVTCATMPHLRDHLSGQHSLEQEHEELSFDSGDGRPIIIMIIMIYLPIIFLDCSPCLIMLIIIEILATICIMTY